MEIIADKRKNNGTRHMPYPPFLELITRVSEISAVIMVIVGLVELVGVFPAFQVGFMFGLSAMSTGVITIVGALMGLGMVYGFVTLVKAQVDMRNVLVNGRDPDTNAA